MNYKFVWVDSESGLVKRQWILPPPLVVGRCPTAEITIDDASISRRHCQFMTDPYGSLMVRDLGSKNGVYVDDRRVDKSIVTPQNEVRMGLVLLRAELTDDERDHIDQEQKSGDVFDLAETEPVKIIRPDDDVYDIG